MRRLPYQPLELRWADDERAWCFLHGEDCPEAAEFFALDWSTGMYVGEGGSSLWLVPKQGEPVLWVKEGWNFVYVP